MGRPSCQFPFFWKDSADALVCGASEHCMLISCICISMVVCGGLFGSPGSTASPHVCEDRVSQALAHAEVASLMCGQVQDWQHIGRSQDSFLPDFAFAVLGMS